MTSNSTTATQKQFKTTSTYSMLNQVAVIFLFHLQVSGGKMKRKKIKYNLDNINKKIKRKMVLKYKTKWKAYNPK